MRFGADPLQQASLAASATDRRSYNTCLATEKIEVFAPMASARERAAMVVKPGLLRNIRVP